MEEENKNEINEAIINVSNNDTDKKNEEFGLSDKEIEKEGILRSNSINFTNDNTKSKSSLEKVDVTRIKSNISRTSTRTSLPPPGIYIYINNKK